VIEIASKTPFLNPKFGDFVGLFKPANLPLAITEDTHKYAPADLLPLPGAFYQPFLEWAEPEVDEFTEFVPCFKVNHDNNFEALIYWKADLTGYTFYLITFTKTGQPISQEEISWFRPSENGVVSTYCNITEDLNILQVSGTNSDLNIVHTMKFISEDGEIKN
jgi:hypothetical protein